MFTLRKPAVYVPLILALLGLVVGAYAVATRGSGGSRLTAGSGNCPPVARDDAAVTKPGEPARLDVLANDTDADGDALTVRVIGVSSGAVELDNGPTGQTFVLTPSGPDGSVSTATYRVEDPSGDVSTAMVSVAVSLEGVLPRNLRTASVNESNGDVVEAHCTMLAKDSTDDSPASPAPSDMANDNAPISVDDAPAETKNARPNRTTTTRSPAFVGDGPSTGDGGAAVDDDDATPNPTTPPAPSPPNDDNDDDSAPCYDAQSCRDYADGKTSSTTEPD